MFKKSFILLQFHLIPLFPTKNQHLSNVLKSVLPKGPFLKDEFFPNYASTFLIKNWPIFGWWISADICKCQW